MLKNRNVQVAPYAGAWIEIDGYGRAWCVTIVAPYAGAWIEIGKTLSAVNYV